MADSCHHRIPFHYFFTLLPLGDHATRKIRL